MTLTAAALSEHVERTINGTDADTILTTDLHPGTYVLDDFTAWARVDRAVTLPTGARVVRWTLADGTHETTRYEPGEHFTRIPDPTATCDANARRGTGTGVCDRPLDQHGQCDRAADHL